LNFPFFWRGARSGLAADDRLGRLRKVLDQARVEYRGDAPESALRWLPVGMPPARQARIDMQKFCFPLPVSGRIALFEGGFERDRNIREFSIGDMEWLRVYGPEALVLPLDAALSWPIRSSVGC